MHCWGPGEQKALCALICANLKRASVDLGICRGPGTNPCRHRGPIKVSGSHRYTQIFILMRVSAPNPVDIVQDSGVHVHSAHDHSAHLADSYPLCKTKNYLRVVTTDSVYRGLCPQETVQSQKTPVPVITERREMVWVIHLLRKQRCLCWHCHFPYSLK